MAAHTHDQTWEEMAAATDQLRETVATASEQARQTVAAAQEQLQQGVTQAQQAQGDLTQALLRLSEQNGRLVTAAVGGFWEASLATLTMAAWGQEQVERTTRQLMEQGRLTREEGAALLRDAAEQAQRQQAELARLAQESLRASLAAMPFGDPATERTPPAG